MCGGGVVIACGGHTKTVCGWCDGVMYVLGGVEWGGALLQRWQQQEQQQFEKGGMTVVVCSTLLLPHSPQAILAQRTCLFVCCASSPSPSCCVNALPPEQPAPPPPPPSHPHTSLHTGPSLLQTWRPPLSCCCWLAGCWPRPLALLAGTSRCCCACWGPCSTTSTCSTLNRWQR